MNGLRPKLDRSQIYPWNLFALKKCYSFRSISVPAAFERSHSNCFYLYSGYAVHYSVYLLLTLIDFRSYLTERSHSDRFWVKLISGSIQLTPTITSLNTVPINTHFLRAHFRDILRFTFSIKSLRGNIRKLGTRMVSWIPG